MLFSCIMLLKDLGTVIAGSRWMHSEVYSNLMSLGVCRCTVLKLGAPNDRQIRHKCLRWFSLHMLRKPVWLVWSCPKKYLSVRMSQGNFGLHESFRWLFRLIRKCQLPLYRSGRKFEDMKQSCFHQKIIGDVIGDLKFQETFFNNNHNILVLTCE